MGYIWAWKLRHTSGPHTASLVLGRIIVTWKRGLLKIRMIIVNETDRTFKDYGKKSYEATVYVRISEYLYWLWSLL